MNKQRQAVYGMRRELLEGEDQKERVMEMVEGIVEQFIDMRCPDDKHPDTWDLAALRNRHAHASSASSIDTERAAAAEPRRRSKTAIFEQLQQKYQEKEDLVGADLMRETERMIMLQRHRQPVERPPAVDGPPEGGHRHCAATARRIRWSSTRRNPTSCSRT